LALAATGGLLLGPGCALKTGAKSDHFDVVIIGGGISGLTTAYLLRNRNILLLEKRAAPGGRIISGQWESLHYPKGMEYIGKPEGKTAVLFNRLGVNAVQVPPPTDAIAYQSTIYYGANLLDFLDAEAETDYWDLEETLNALNDGGIEEAIFYAPEDLADFAEYDSQSVDEWLKANEYDALVQLFVDVENRGLFGANNQDLSFLFDIPEMAYNLPDPDEAALSDVYTFPTGMSEVVDALVNLLSGRIEVGAEVNQVSVNPDQSVTIAYQQGGETKTVRADSAVLTTPAPITASMIVNGFSQAVLDRLGDIAYSAYVTLNLFTSERLWKDAWTMACLDDFFVTLYDAIRLQVPLNYDEKGILGVYIAPPNAGDTSLLSMSDADLLENALAGLEKYYPQVRVQTLGHDIHRFRHAFPVFGKNYHQTLQVLRTDPTTQGPLFLAGDYMVYATFDGAVLSAFRACEQVNDYLGNAIYLPLVQARA